MYSSLTKRMLVLLPLVLAMGAYSATLEAATINVDISGDDAPMPDTMGRYWNPTPKDAPASPSYLLSNATDETNSATPVDLYLVTPLFHTTSIQTGKTNSSITDWDDAVTQDNWYVVGGSTAEARLEGLLPGFSYDLLFYGARATDNDRRTRITINSINGDYDATDEGLTTFSGIQANASGEILFGVTTYSGGTYAHLSGFQISGTFVTQPVPEPSSVWLMLGMLSCCAARFRREVKPNHTRGAR